MSSKIETEGGPGDGAPPRGPDVTVAQARRPRSTSVGNGAVSEPPKPIERAQGVRAISTALLSAEQILGATDVLFEDVPCPEWGGSVRIRGLTGRERDDYEIELVSIKQTGKSTDTRLQLSGAREKLVSKCAIDAQGNRLFTDAQAAQLGTKNGRVLDRLFTVASKLSGLRDKDIEDLVGNSTAALSGGSLSA